MAINIPLRAAEQDFEIAEQVQPIKVDLTAAGIRGKNKGLVKLSLSVSYFFVLVYFLIKLLA